MSGPEHYLEAEQLLQLARTLMSDGDIDAERQRDIEFTLRAAEVHARLALAAAVGVD